MNFLSAAWFACFFLRPQAAVKSDKKRDHGAMASVVENSFGTRESLWSSSFGTSPDTSTEKRC